MVSRKVRCGELLKLRMIKWDKIKQFEEQSRATKCLFRKNANRLQLNLDENPLFTLLLIRWHKYQVNGRELKCFQNQSVSQKQHIQSGWTEVILSFLDNGNISLHGLTNITSIRSLRKLHVNV